MSVEDERDARTVFVRNVAFDVDQPQLEQAFADIGPVRSAFLVTQKGQQRHKGVAFVQYAIPEDAERAVEELNGKELNGRKLKIELARKRAPLAERKQRKRSAEDLQQQQEQENADEPSPAAAAAVAPSPASKKHKPNQQQQQQQTQSAAAKHKWLRTVALGGLKPEFKSHALRLAAAAGNVTEVLDQPPADVAAKAHLQQDGCSGDVVFVVYESVKEATMAVKQLHNKTITAADITAAANVAGSSSSKKQRKLDKKAARAAAKQQQQQQQDGAAAAAAADADDSVVLWARVVSGEGALVKKWRLILRNLPWQATEADILKLLSTTDSYAWQVQIPKGSDGRTPGFAFLSFLSYPEAEAALKAANGQLVRKRPVAADWAVSKGQYQELKSQTPAAAAAAAGDHHDQQGSEDSDGGSDHEQGLDGSDEEGSSGFSDSEDLDQGIPEGSEELQSGDQDSGDDHDDDLDDAGFSYEDDQDSSSDESEELDESENEESEEFEHDREVTAHALDAVLAGATKQQQQQQQTPAAAADGLSAKENKQQQQPQQQQQTKAEEDLGHSASADKAVARTVFVRGISTDTTSQELQARFDRFGSVKACRLVMNKATGKPKGTAFIEFRDPAGAAAAAAACARARAGKGPEILVKGVKLDVDLALTGDDARKLGQSLTGDGSKGVGGKFDRRNMYLAKEGFIEEGSQQWMSMSENDRRKRKRAAEEKNEKLKSPNFAVSTTRLAVRNIPGSWDERKLKSVFIVGVKQRATKEHPEVKQVKILRDPERSDPGGHPGGKSRGFGFVEFSDHTHALAALRQLNNNPTAFGSADRRPIVEFAVDNVKILKARDSKLAKQKQMQQQKQQQKQEQNGHDAEISAEVHEKEAGGQSQQQQQQQQDEQQQEAANGEKLSKRQLKRRKEKAKKIKRQQQQQQQNGVAAVAGPDKQRSNQPQQQLQQQQQQRKKKGIAANAAAAAAEAKEARTAAKTKRQQQQAAAEEAVRSKKRRADSELDRLAAAAEGANAAKQQHKQQQQGKGKVAAAAAGEEGRKRHKPGRAQEDRLEQMVLDYKAKLFGVGSSAAASGGVGASKKQQQRQGIKGSRWFD